MYIVEFQLYTLPHPSSGEIIIRISPANKFAGWIPLTQYRSNENIL